MAPTGTRIACAGGFLVLAPTIERRSTTLPGRCFSGPVYSAALEDIAAYTRDWAMPDGDDV